MSPTPDAGSGVGPFKLALSVLVGVLVGTGLVYSIVSREIEGRIVRWSGDSPEGIAAVLFAGIGLFVVVVVGTWVLYQVFMRVDR